MANTPFLDLVKPAGTDRALVSVINSNSDKIDTGVSTLSEQMGKTNIHVDVSSQTYNNVAGATALFNALPTQFKGTCYATFTSGYNAVCLVDKHSATYGSIIYEVDWDTAPFHFVMKNGTASLDQLALNSKIENRTGSFHCEGIGVGITASRCDVFFPITGLKTNGTVSITSLGVTNLWTGSQGKDHASVIVIYNTGIVVRLTDSNANPFTTKNAYYCSADITVS